MLSPLTQELLTDPAARASALAKAYLRPEFAAGVAGPHLDALASDLTGVVKGVYWVAKSASALEAARGSLGTKANLEFLIKTSPALPFEDQTLDVLFAELALDDQVDAMGMLRELARVLRPGGRLLLFALPPAEVTATQMRGWLQEAGLVNRIVDSAGGALLAAGTTRIIMRGAVQKSYTAAALAGSCGCTPVNQPESCCAAPADGASCCSGSSYEDVAFVTTYEHQDLSAVPQEAAEFSLGCGNPLALAGLQPGEVVLDIGSGGGLDSFLAANKVGPGGHVIGVDMTPAMLKRARSAARRNGIANVEFRQGYAEALPLEDHSVDVILSNCVINLTEDKGVVFDEAFRVLKPGGRLEVSDIVSDGAFPFDLQQDQAGWSECVTSALPEQEYLDLVWQSGFEMAAVRRSASAGDVRGVGVYSVIVSAKKPAL